jgi:uncharacterized protein YdgA (DUF945 family)
MKDGETLIKKRIKSRVSWEGKKDTNEYVNGFKYYKRKGDFEVKANQ